MTTTADRLVERGADRLEELSERAASRGGAAGKVADELADDAAFLRKLKPSLMVARAKGEAPTDGRPGRPPRAPGRAQHGSPRTPGGRTPWPVLAAALAAGVLLAKLIDWRGHAHPRD